jgi:carbonic anhydrase/acetyltransferase-like protein (isoleucine patch superfamily)
MSDFWVRMLDVAYQRMLTGHTQRRDRAPWVAYSSQLCGTVTVAAASALLPQASVAR